MNSVYTEDRSKFRPWETTRLMHHFDRLNHHRYHKISVVPNPRDDKYQVAFNLQHLHFDHLRATLALKHARTTLAKLQHEVDAAEKDVADAQRELGIHMDAAKNRGMKISTQRTASTDDSTPGSILSLLVSEAGGRPFCVHLAEATSIDDLVYHENLEDVD